MSVDYRLDNNLVVLVASGVVRIQDFISTLHHVIKDPHFIPGSKTITDEINATYETTDVESKEAVFFLRSFQDMFANKHAAIARNSSNYKMIKLIEKTCQGYGVNFKAFDDKEKAYKWIRGNAV
jgi:hypothetical protein